MPLSPDQVTEWQEHTKDLPEPHRANLLGKVALGDDTWDMFSTAPKTEAAMRRVFKDTYGMGSFALESVVAWAVKRGAAAGGEGPDSAPNRAVSKAAIDALAKAEREGLVGDDRMDMVQRALDLAEKEAPALQGKSPFARALHLHGNDSGLLGGDAAALAIRPE